MTKTEMAQRIKNHYEATSAAGEWMSVVSFAETTDATPAEIAEALVQLARTDDQFNLAPESNQKMLTEMDHLYAVRFGGQDKHIFCWS